MRRFLGHVIHLAVSASFPFPGGDSLATLRLAEALGRRGYRITLVLTLGRKRFPLPSGPKPVGGIHRLIYLESGTSFRTLVCRLAQDPPELFLNTGGADFAQLTALALKRPALARVTGPQTWFSSSGRLRPRARVLIRKYGLFSDCVIAVSDFVKSAFREEGVRHVKMIYEGCDPEEFRPSAGERASFRSEFGLREEALAIGIMANMDPLKRQDIAIRAVARLRRKYPLLRCFLIGGAFNASMRRHEGRLRELVNKLGLDRQVVFAGLRRDRNRVMNGLDIAAFPFVREGCCNALLEAMACGKPVLVNDSDSFREIVTGGCEGVMVPREDPEAFARGLDRLIRLKPHWKALGDRGRLRVRSHFSVERQARAYDRLLRTVLRTAGRETTSFVAA